MVRQYLFRKALRLMAKRTPDWFRALQLRILTRITARAFSMPLSAAGRSVGNQADALESYAAFTQVCMKEGRPDPKRIYRAAYAAGRCIRLVTGFKKPEDLSRLVFFLYRNIGITMSGTLPGEITVRACYFSCRYTPAQCRLMSFMDSGLVAGICGCRRLIFTRRITQGDPSCRACLY